MSRALPSCRDDIDAAAAAEAMAALRDAVPDAYAIVRSRFDAVDGMRSALGRLSPTASASLLGSEPRTEESLIAELLRDDRGDRLLYLPSRAVFRRSVVAAEAQARSALARACSGAGIRGGLLAAAQELATRAVLALMAEDAYLDILDGEAPEPAKRSAASRLIALWDSDLDCGLDDSTEALVAVWTSRKSCRPAFGTLLGSSELVGLSMSLDGRWFAFAGDRFSDPRVYQALAEFLFGLSHEELEACGAHIDANGPQDVAGVEALFGGRREYPEPASADPRDLYRFYEARRGAAKRRAATGAPGPRSTLEGEYLLWAMGRRA